MALEDLLDNNQRWAAEQLEKDPLFFEKRKHSQSPRLLWIGCSDSRVPAEQLLGCQPGDLFVHRNIANVVAYNDVNIAAVVQYAVEHLMVQDIVVCGHYGCGGVRAACEDHVVGGYIGDWLMITSWAKRWVDARLETEGFVGDKAPCEEEYLQLVVEENVRLQVKHLGMLSMMRGQWKKQPGIPRLHGWVYDIGTGRVKIIDPSATELAHLPTEAD